MPDSPTVATEEPERGFEVRGRRPPGEHTLKILMVPIIALIVISNVGDAMAVQLVDERPQEAHERPVDEDHLVLGVVHDVDELLGEQPQVERVEHRTCLLYTSDAADEL